MTIEYVGGEILTIPHDELEQIVFFTREYLQTLGISCHDGVQTNLIASRRRISELYRLFEGRVGTSIDSFSHARTIKGSHSAYQAIFDRSNDHIETVLEAGPVAGVLTVTNDNIKHVLKELQKANIQSRDITIRPVFHGGSEVSLVTADSLSDVYNRALERWMMHSRIRIEPFYSLLRKLLKTKYGEFFSENMDMCPFQSNCHRRSLSLEPNGDVYVCQDLADHGQLKLGNALANQIDHGILDVISARESFIDVVCGSCTYFEVCHGGCMQHSIQSGLSLLNKTPYCDVWFSLLEKMHSTIERVGVIETVKWVNKIGERKE